MQIALSASRERVGHFTGLLGVQYQIQFTGFAGVKRADFEVAGDTMKFEMVTRLGTLEGNIKMVVRGKARTPENEPK